MDRFEEYSRLTGDGQYKEIAKSNYVRFGELHTQTLTLREKISSILSACDDPHDPPDEYHDISMRLDPIEEERDKCAVLVVVFSAMYLEAFIYDYAATCLGDSYVKNHLDKLDLISKWIVIPRLVTGKEISKESQAFELLKKINKARNALVHLKSIKGIHGDELNEYMEQRESEIVINAKCGVEAMRLVIEALFELDPDHPKVMLDVEKST